MAETDTSRYRMVPIFIDDRDAEESGREQDLTYYGSRTPLSYRDDPDTTIHIVSEGDTLTKLANTYYQGFSNPPSLWWAIAEFQQTPINDPTIKMEPGTFLHIPSPSLVSKLLNEGALNNIP